MIWKIIGAICWYLIGFFTIFFYMIQDDEEMDLGSLLICLTSAIFGLGIPIIFLIMWFLSKINLDKIIIKKWWGKK